ncbi:MAG TPA: PAS domain-containing protein [Gaiellaceae bacterium]|nr:PAS domain-containing protein [Gaiellaceae bacterium]
MTHPGLAAPEIQAQLIAEALGGATVGILVWDDDGRYIAANDAACSILGTTLEELLGQRVGAHTRGGEALVEEALRDEPVAGDATVERFDGSGTIRVRYLTFTTRTAGMPFMATIIWR